jgi:hypothetical protein
MPVYDAVTGRTHDKEKHKQQKLAEKHKGANIEVGGRIGLVSGSGVALGMSEEQQ